MPPKPLNVDWSVAQSLYLQGISPTEIGRRLGVKYNTVITRANREEWKRKRDQVQAVFEKGNVQDLAMQVATASAKVRSRMAERLVALSEKLPSSPRSLKQELAIQQDMEAAVRNAERIFNWQGENASALVRTTIVRSATVRTTIGADSLQTMSGAESLQSSILVPVPVPVPGEKNAFPSVPVPVPTGDPLLRVGDSNEYGVSQKPTV